MLVDSAFAPQPHFRLCLLRPVFDFFDSPFMVLQADKLFGKFNNVLSRSKAQSYVSKVWVLNNLVLRPLC